MMFNDEICLFVFFGILAIILFVIWLIYRDTKDKNAIKPHKIMYGLAFVSGIFTFLYFFSIRSITTEIKIITSIFVGLLLIFIGSWAQKNKPKKEE